MPPEEQQERPSDVALLVASSSGDKAAFEEFVDRHKAALFRFTRAISSTPSEAEEAMQQTFVSAWLHAATFRGDGPARSWLYRIARNAQNKMHRRHVGEPSEHEEISELGRLAGWDCDVPPLSDVIENREWVQQSLASLPTDDQEILVLIEIEGFSLREAGETLELSVAATKSRLHRARLRLLAALRKDQDHA